MSADEAAVAPPSALVDQLTFYFSESNLAKDRFLRHELSKTSDRSMPVSVLLRFNKVKAISEELAVVAAALRRVPGVSVSEDGLTVRRLEDLPESVGFDGRTIYAECLPRNPSVDSLRPIFERLGQVTYLSLPRVPDTKTVKGFCFVEYVSDAVAQSALDRIRRIKEGAEDEDKLPPPERHATNVLKAMRVMSKTRWLELRAEYVAYHAQLLAEKRSSGKKRKEGAAADAVTVAAAEPTWTRNVLVAVDGVPAASTSASIKAFMEGTEHKNAVEYVEYKRKTTQCIVRFRTEDAARSALVRLNGTTFAEGADGAVSMRLIQGDEETEYWRKIAEIKEARKKRKEGTPQLADMPGKETKKLKKLDKPPAIKTSMTRKERRPRDKAVKTERMHVRFSDNEEDEEQDSPRKRSTEGENDDEAQAPKRQRTDT